MKIHIGIAVLLLTLTGCAALGIQSKVEEAREKALAQAEKIACADVKETQEAVKGSKFEQVDWAAICQ